MGAGGICLGDWSPLEMSSFEYKLMIEYKKHELNIRVDIDFCPASLSLKILVLLSSDYPKNTSYQISPSKGTPPVTVN